MVQHVLPRSHVLAISKLPMREERNVCCAFLAILLSCLFKLYLTTTPMRIPPSHARRQPWPLRGVTSSRWWAERTTPGGRPGASGATTPARGSSPRSGSMKGSRRRCTAAVKSLAILSNPVWSAACLTGESPCSDPDPCSNHARSNHQTQVRNRLYP